MIVTTVMDKYMDEILKIMREHDALAQGAADVLPIKRALNKTLSEALFRHKRELDLAAGEKIEPIAHEASAVLFPVMGGGGF